MRLYGFIALLFIMEGTEMSAFDKIQSGIAGLDEALNHVRLGDNVVWQISELEEFAPLRNPLPVRRLPTVGM